MKLVDLSHPIKNDTPVYPGDPMPQVKENATFDNEGYWDHVVTLGTHLGTHIDAPASMLKGAKQLKDFPIERYVLPATCIDVSSGFSRESIEAADIKEGMAVLFYTGASDYFMEPRYWEEYTAMDKSLAELLASKKVSLVGVDAGSVDIEEDFPIHMTLLQNEIHIIENLTNLKELVGQTFELIALPLKLENDGAPVRAVARLQ